MPLRDLLMLSALLVLVPMILIRPHTGAILWAWTAMLVPNTFLFGIGQSVRFNLIFAIATVLAWVISKEPKKVSFNGTNLLLLFFLFWVGLATAFGVAPEEVRSRELIKLIKIVIFTIVITGLMTSRRRVHALLFGLCLGMGYHGAAEGAKFIASGGNHHVFGPSSSIIGDNNHFALAMIFILPVVYYLYSYAAKPLVRITLLGTFALVFVSIIGTFSRGGLIGLMAVGLFGLFKSRHRFAIILALCLGGGFVLYFAPEDWFARMATIQEADKVGSFMGRVIAWKISTLLALDHPLLGGGLFAIQNSDIWIYYSARFDLLSFIPTPPFDPRNSHAAHSIYFQVLGDTGFVGLAIFLLILIRTWRSCSKLIKQTADLPALQWIHNLSRAFQISLVAYGVSGAALNMAYFEMLYVFVALVAIQEEMVKRHLRTIAPGNTPVPLEIGAGKRVITEAAPPVRPMERPVPRHYRIPRDS